MLNKRVNTAIEKINCTTKSEQDVFEIFHSICNDFDIEQFALAVFSGKKKITESFSVYNTYSKEWEKRYNDERYYLCDPVFNTLKKIAVPFEWSTDSFDNLLPIQQTLMEESRDFGIKSGITIPLIPHPTFHSFVTVLNHPFLHPEVLYTLSLVSNVCANKISNLKDNEALASLTEREIAILSQKAQGATIKVIGYNLNIAESTVAFHLDSVRKKLNVNSTEHAVSKFVLIMNQQS